MKIFATVLPDNTITDRYWSETAKDLSHIEVPDYAVDGWSYTNGQFYPPLSNVKQAKVLEVKKEGLKRIALIFPAVRSVEELDLISEFWLSIAPAARQPTANFTQVINIRAAAKAAIIAVNALLTLQEVINYDPVTDPTWPA